MRSKYSAPQVRAQSVVDVVVDVDVDVDETTRPLHRQPRMFGFQGLDVYRCAVEFLGHAAGLAGRAPRGFSALGDQLRRAALSISLNIAEGSGKPDRDAKRFYGIARGSALECAAILDAFGALRFVEPAELVRPTELLERVVSMLTRMARN